MRGSNKGFSLVEVIMVVLILGIIGGLAIPVYFNLKKDAQIAADMAGIGSVQTAITTAYLKNVVNGSNTYPSANPFDLTTPPMPSQDIGTTPDDQHWQTNYLPGCTAYYLYCPHFRQTPTTKGMVWYYAYGDGECWGRKKGQFLFIADYGH